MAARKLQQEVDKCFKKVTEGVAEFDAIYEKIGQSNNTAQKEKLEDNLKREIKKLQRLRDQIKTWAAGNEIKDKGPLMENRRLIETQMERFKAVEKAMKTKAYSKEGLSAATKLDPKEQAKHEAGEFLSQQVDELEQQIESLEAERESIQATVKRGKLHGAKADRMSRIDNIIDRHKWHQGKLELIRRSLENGGVEVDQVNDLDESIRYYVTDGMNDDFMEDESIYDDLNLEDDDGFGLPQDNDKGSSQDNHSIQGDFSEAEAKPAAAPSSAPPAASSSSSKGRQAAAAEPATSTRRPSAQLKSPLPTVATLHTPLPTLSNGSTAAAAGMKPASIPARPAGETLKYASAAAAAAASDKLGLGIAPLPPPISAAVHTSKNLGSAANSPKPASVQPAAPSEKSASPAVSLAATASSTGPSTTSAKAEPATRTARGKAAAAAAASAAAAAATGASTSTSAATAAASSAPSAAPAASASTSASTSASASASAAASATPAATDAVEPPSKAASHANGVTTNGARTAPAIFEAAEDEERDEESIYHLPESLRDLVESFEVTKARKTQSQSNPEARLRMLAQSSSNPPEALDSEPARRYFPDVRYSSAFNFPHEPLALLDDPRLYSRVDPDTLFYVFYYKQGTYQQYLAAKALKDMSWRFHKQYQTWFQRHEEPKSITEEFEQGTYRFFDYESTWMNRRKADFKFVYKYLEDDV